MWGTSRLSPRSRNRVKKTVSSTTTLYWPGAGGLLNESNGTATTWGKQVHFAGLLVWHEDSSGSGRFLFHDHLGSVRITGTAAGTNPPSDDIDYQSFGSIFNNYGSSPSNNHYLFTGDERDSESGTNYALARNQSPVLGRFNRPDPYDGSYNLANPQSLNRYTYVLNSPLIGADPSGLEEQIPGVGGGMGGDDCADDCSGDCGDDCGGDCGNDCGGDCGYDCGSSPNDPSNGGQNSNSNNGYPQGGKVWDDSLGLPAGSLPGIPGITDILGDIANSMGFPDLTGMDCMPICRETLGPENNEMPAMPSTDSSHRRQPYGQCFNNGMNYTSPGNGVLITATGASLVGLISPNPFSKGAAIVNTFFNLARIISVGLVCSDPNADLGGLPTGGIYH